MAKNPRYERRLLVLLLTLITVFASIPVWAFAAPAEANIAIAVKAGYDDTARVGASVPFNISLINKGGDVSGEVQVLVSANPEARVIYAAPVSLPDNSDKVVSMEVPVLTANKKIEVRFVKNGKTLKSVYYEFVKLIAPETPTIGVLCDDTNSFKGLKGMKITQTPNMAMAADIQRKMAFAAASAQKAAAIGKQILPDIPAEVIQLDANTMPSNLKAMNGFDMLIISNFDTSSLTDKQKETVESWVNSGKTLFLGTGPNWKKVYSGLKDTLRPFEVNGTKSIQMPKSIIDFTGKSNIQGNMNIVTGSAGSGKVVASEKVTLVEGGSPLAVTYKKDNGLVSLLAFDPSLSPIAEWSDVQTFWQNLIAEVKKTEESSANSQPGAQPGVVYPVSTRPYMDFQYLASNVPETQTPPFLLLLVIMGVYILLAGPAIYLFLKWRDKRDFNWVAIPAAALLFMGIIYVVGYKTRYTTAVLNNISLITLDTDKKTADITTWMGAFNNGRGNMKVEYDKNLNLEVNNNNYYGERYGPSYPDQDGTNGRIVSKLTYSDPLSYELFDVRLWEARFLYASKSVPTKGFDINPVTVNGGKFAATIKNNTDYNMKEAFITIGSNFIEAGDIPAGGEKKVEADLASPATKKRFDEFLDSRYGQPNYGQPQKNLPPDWAEKMRKRNIFENVLRNMLYTVSGEAKIMLFALSDSDQGYDVIINGKAPKKFNTNIIFASAPINFEKGKQVEIPSGIFKPVLDDPKNASFDDPLMGGVRVHNDGDVDFKFTLPDSIKVEKFQIDWDTYLPAYVKYRPKPAKGSPQPSIAKNTYKFFIFNNSTSNWEEMNRKFEASSGISNYISDKGELKLRVNALLDRSGAQEELLGIPELKISGVVK